MPKPRKGGGGGGGGGGPDLVLRWVAWAVGLLLLASAFVPLRHDLARGLSWVACGLALLEAGVSIGRSRRGAFAAYAAIAVLVNPFVPFHFAPQIWRLVWAGAGLWMLADHLPGRG